MDLRFTHPNEPTTFPAHAEDTLTALQAVEDLVASSFLAPVTGRREYALVNSRTRGVILPGTTLRDAGVRDGDVIEVVQAVEGGR